MRRCALAYLGLFVMALIGLPAYAQLDYVDRSWGLQTPQMEGGKTELEFGDVNGDGHVDIVSIGDHGSPYVNTQEHGVMVWFGDGTGNWSVYQNGNFGYGGVALGDVNNDGLMDVGYGMHHNYSGVDFGDQLLEVALGDGTGQNWTPWDDGLATNGESWGMFGTDFADIDNDGDLDLGSTSFGCCNGVHVYRNNGDGTWTQTFGSSGGNSASIFAFGDINGDGFADCASARGSDNDTTYLGNGNGGFTPADGNLPLPPSGGRPGVSLGDVNDDGRDDLGFVNDSGGLDVWSWLAPGTWQDLSGNLPAAGGFYRIQIADMNLDGHGDVVAFDPGDPNGLLVVYAGDGSGNWQQVASVATPQSCDCAAFRAGVDADHNGYPDITFVAEEDCDWLGGTNRPRCYAESSTPATMWIHPASPRGGETFYAGSVQFIDWHAADPLGQQPLMTIELSKRGPDGPWTTVATDVPNNGRFQWRIPPNALTSADCYLRFHLDEAVAVTPAPFTIIGVGCPGDLDGDGDTDQSDLGILLSDWGCDDPVNGCAGDLNGDDKTDQADLGILLSDWGCVP